MKKKKKTCIYIILFFFFNLNRLSVGSHSYSHRYAVVNVPVSVRLFSRVGVPSALEHIALHSKIPVV